MSTGVDALPAVEDLPPLATLPALAGCRAFEESSVIADLRVIDHYITQRLNELHTTPENLPALQKVVFELLHKARLTAVVLKWLRGKF